MKSISNNKQRSIKQQLDSYNLLLNLFWSALSFIPLCLFCYQWMATNMLVLFIGLSFIPLLFTTAIITKLQLSQSTKVYKRLGIAVIQHLSQNGVLIHYLIRMKHPQYKAVRRERSSIERLLKQTYLFEKFHLMGLVFFGLTSIYALYKDLPGWAALLTLINLGYNVYPILLQQYIRLKLAGYTKPLLTSKPVSNGFAAFKLKCIG